MLICDVFSNKKISNSTFQYFYPFNSSLVTSQAQVLNLLNKGFIFADFYSADETWLKKTIIFLFEILTHI